MGKNQLKFFERMALKPEILYEFIHSETSLKFLVEQNSTFFVDYQYDRLYFVFYEDFLHYDNVTEDLQTELVGRRQHLE